ncbi:MAG: efflux transporter periplasmic adaptor subunit [Sphingomonadales bacterium 35-56-22]|jgi:RND family efflux transporter MFP subunit|uniref:efflux RND transporter periplasmic adaptor subunit n=1 Tax=Sphingorhabdus sp. TaxID=1902408 RepID=UPI000BD887A3|nr:efflux RND transporter periplasmic adaptor subunit [Sphingorhabdus sp.]OYY15711.1 MAG: efflux transporter periplasmic adaptor subunit [Sphingomonadales bacterium 35-56-22]OYY98010.1 MAG: efflux transporter periplasmic adaptor subunit [Sphingomonadales bacterium 28-56-43]OYZ60493.1 MAG: efflux transporter periplasmic adaptor subunit [Sphingomonadales bacterium 24-56-14]OZA82969.1 MAG: efflux transporter periplasmic adaptor subunit [Sphingomonadales bacterium 39-57-19]HQS13163.1 efflux RND tr
MTLPFTTSRRGWLLLAVLLPLLLLFAWVALRSGPLAPVNVTVVQVEDRAISPALFGIGTVEARYTQKVGPTAAGRVSMVAVDVGDTVKEGQLIAQIDPIDLDQRIDAAAGGSARSAALEQAAVAQIADATARVALAQSQAARTEKLKEGGWVTDAMVDQRRQELAGARASLAAAQANRNAAGQDRGRLGAERAALVQQKANLRLVAPHAGLVVRRAVEPGTTVVAGQAVIEIIDPSQLWINVRFDQTQSAGLAAGLPVRIALRSRPESQVAGTIERVEPMADALTEEVLAKALFSLAEGIPSIGELAEVTVALPARARTPAIPNAAVHRVDGQVGVWVIRGGDLDFVKVKIGAQNLDGWVQILDGLKTGEQIILHSAKALSANSRFSIVKSLP